VLHPSRHGLLGEGGWFARAWTPLDEGGADDAGNAEALCWRCCLRATDRT
jgi:hypothetical protein